MRKHVAEVLQGTNLRQVLDQIGPSALASYLEESPGFRIKSNGKELEFVPDADSTGRYRVAGTGLIADVAIDFIAELGVLVQSTTLTNSGQEATPPLQALQAFHLPLNVFVKDKPYACGIGGGQTEGYYPPRSFREEIVSFGQVRQWEPDDPTFTRWWVARRWFRLACDEKGWSSNPYLPLMFACWHSQEGEIGLWAALEWSGRWEIQFGTTDQLQWQFIFSGGPVVKELVLGPGESIRLPNVHIGAFGGAGKNLEDGFNHIRRYVAEVLAPDVEGKRPWPFVAYHHWFGIEQRLSDELLRHQVDRAAELGVEFFEVDAAWYGGASQNFADGVGNWERFDESKFPYGLKAFSDYVRSKGIRFGLWFEPERGRRGSDWVTQHPEWYWDIGHPLNLHLDLTQLEVQDYLIKMLSGWIEELDIRWLRWDYNQPPGPFWDAVDPTGKVQFRYIEGLYRVRSTLLERFPNLLIDNCASGGNRIDFGTLHRAGTMVISDHAEDPHICRVMQTGGARVLPANYMNSSFYVGEHDGDRLHGPLELMSRMAGAISFSGHIANFSPTHTKLIQRYLDGYRTFRHLLMKDFHPLRPYPRTVNDWDVVEFLDPQSHEAVILAYRVLGEEGVGRVFPKRLDSTTNYSIIDPFASATVATRSGQELMTKGLEVVLDPESALVRHLIPTTE